MHENAISDIINIILKGDLQMKKKIFVAVLLVFCVGFLASCGKKPVSEPPEPASVSSQAEETPESSPAEESKDGAADDGQAPDEENKGDDGGAVSDGQASEEAPAQESIAAAKGEQAQQEDENEELVDGMRPDFKEAMDSYEAFYDEYCNFMEKYDENPSDLKMLAEYASMLAKANDMAEKFDAWESSDLNDAELSYYLAVNSRVAQKLLEVAQ